jgi:uncharacterized membrane protein
MSGFPTGKFPLFTLLMLLQAFASVTAFFVGGWLCYASQFAYSSWKVIEGFNEHAGQEMPHSKTQENLINTTYFTLLIVGIIVIVLGFFMLWHTMEILLLISPSSDNCCEPVKKYKHQIEQEWTSLVKYRGF